MNTDQQIKELHAVYCAISKQNIGLRYNRESAWIEFIRSGFTKPDLEAVLKRLVRLVESGDRRIEALKFSNVVEQIDRFEEELALIKSEASGLKASERKMSVMDLKIILNEKELQRAFISEHNAHDSPFGLVWDNVDARAKHMQLSEEIRDIRYRISRMV